MAARQTLRDLEKADRALERAHGSNGDELVAHRVERARKELRDAIRRARDRLKDTDLRGADQGRLL